jgi:Tfp pilus assembly protein PilN
MRAVNLLPRDDARSKSRQTNPVVLGGVIATVAATAIIAAAFLTVSAGVADKQERLDAAQAELDSTPVPPPADNSATALQQERGQRVVALSTALGRRVAWDRILRELSLVLPEDVWLSTLSAKAPSEAAAADAPAGFTITGKTYSHEGVARLLSRLSVLPDLTDVELQRSTLTTTPGQPPQVDFTIVANVRPAGATS